MSNNFDFNSKKYMILLVLICIVFAIFIIKAFDYLPENDVYDAYNEEVENINTASSNVNVPQNVDKQEIQKPVQKKGVLYKSQDSLSENDMEFDEIDAPKGINETVPDETISETANSQLSSDELALKSIINARRYAKNNDAQASLEEFKKTLSLATDNEIKAEAYDGMALLYAKNQKYSTALSFASKANSTSPSISREFIIAKIYYSAGKSDIAITKINEILKQSFRN